MDRLLKEGGEERTGGRKNGRRVGGFGMKGGRGGELDRGSLRGEVGGVPASLRRPYRGSGPAVAAGCLRGGGRGRPRRARAGRRAPRRRRRAAREREDYGEELRDAARGSL